MCVRDSMNGCQALAMWREDNIPPAGILVGR